jgi:hypothetical protein
MTAAAGAAPPARLSMVCVVAHPDKGSQVGVIAKRTYRVAGQKCLVADEQDPLVEAPQMSEDQSVLLHDMDGVVNRTDVDVIVDGKAHPPRAASSSFEVRIRVAGLDRKVLVIGDRRCYRDTSGRLRFGDAKPVDEVLLDWTCSYGGIDATALARHGDPLQGARKEMDKPYNPRFGRYAYPRNRAGKGYLIEATNEALEACALPNVEEPLQRLSPEGLAIGHHDRWPSGPPVAAVGWLSYGNFPRSAMLAMPTLYDATACPPASFFEVKGRVMNAASIEPVMAIGKRFDLRVAQQSALGMRTPNVAPGAAVSIAGAHPKHTTWEFTLAHETPLLALQMPGTKPIGLEAKIRTVYLQPELDRVSIVWVGEHREATPVGPGKRALIKHAVQWPR